MRFFVGGYTADMDGAATGIAVLDAGDDDDGSAGGALSRPVDVAVRAESPSWIAWHATLPVIYAALEKQGAVQAFQQVGEASFAPLGAPVIAGEALCHVAPSPDGASLLASCWGDGRLVRMAVDEEGRPSAPVALVTASDPYALEGIEQATPRQSRAHQARHLPIGVIATTDMGLDLVRFWRPGSNVPDQEVALPFGSGPRHMRWHPSGHLYVVTELSLEVFVLAPSISGEWRVIGATPLAPGMGGGSDFAAEIALSRDAEFVYVAIRGSNTIATLRVRGNGAELHPVALVESGVDWPRHHVVVRDTLLVAGQLSHEVATLTLDQRTGIPARARRRIAVPSPTCLLPGRA